MAKKAEAVSTPAVPEGFARVMISKWDDDSQGYVWQASEGSGSQKRVVATVHGKLYILLPITVEAQTEAMKDASSSFNTDDGKVKVTGHAAPAARKAYSDHIEPVRGEVRKAGVKGVDLALDVVQQMLDDASPYSGTRGGSRSVSREKLESMTEEEQLAYLTARFVK